MYAIRRTIIRYENEPPRSTPHELYVNNPCKLGELQRAVAEHHWGETGVASLKDLTVHDAMLIGPYPTTGITTKWLVEYVDPNIPRTVQGEVDDTMTDAPPPLKRVGHILYITSPINLLTLEQLLGSQTIDTLKAGYAPKDLSLNPYPMCEPEVEPDQELDYYPALTQDDITQQRSWYRKFEKKRRW